MSFPAMRHRAVRAVRNYFHTEWTAENLFDFYEVSPFIRLHLDHFYFSLLMTLISSTIGSCCLYPTENAGGIFSLFVASVSFICFYLTAPWREKKKRLCFLMVGACFGCASVTPWLSWLLGVDTGFVGSIILANCVGIGCFWGASKWTRRFEVLYFKAMVLCSPLLLITLLITSTIFGGDSHVGKYPAAYSQEVVLKARRGDVDPVDHAICLYTHLPSFLIHPLSHAAD